jgi:hypothetical protein
MTPPDPQYTQLKGCLVSLNPCTYQVKQPVSKFAFQIQLAPLHSGVLAVGGFSGVAVGFAAQRCVVGFWDFLLVER